MTTRTSRTSNPLPATSVAANMVTSLSTNCFKTWVLSHCSRSPCKASTLKPFCHNRVANSLQVLFFAVKINILGNCSVPSACPGCLSLSNKVSRVPILEFSSINKRFCSTLLLAW
eukprot:Lithocolla_globosa_v1_NODE_10900_length_554_cov_1.537074.p2 type:complete len:115 gc:universal NODE_10900_length_554_cov_1.537074:174-518(+)